MNTHPNFKVMALPAPGELKTLAISALCEHLPGFDLDKLRMALMDECFVTKWEENVRFDLMMMEGPLALSFNVQFEAIVSMIVVLQPEHFDRTQRDQEALFQKCLGILNVLCDAPFAKEQVDDISDGFTLGEAHCDSQVRWWKKIRRRWTATK